MSLLYCNQFIRDFEADLIRHKGYSEEAFMAQAGQVAFDALRTHWPAARRITVCCGGGNNGGDGYVLARLAQGQNFEVTLYALTPIEKLPPAALNAAQLAQAAGVKIIYDANPAFFESDIIVDALLGSGLSGEVNERYTQVISAINATPCPVIALDIPSGLQADTGCVLGCVVRADLTVTFIALKQGLFTHEGPTYCGHIIESRIGINKTDFQALQPTASLLNWDELSTALPRRARHANKGDYGHVLVVGGDYGMPGAIRMAAEAAMRVGAGLVSVATHPEHVSIVSGACPEVMCHAVNHAAELDLLIDRATVLIIGPGLGKTDWSHALLDRVLSSRLPKIMDADALTLLSDKKVACDHWILTPHPGEASRLLQGSVADVQSNRFLAIEQLQKRYGGVIVLKGVGTLVKDADTYSAICPAGNPGMASGGMGDVLSGVLAGLLAQGLSLSVAAKVGVLIHSLAADQAAAVGGERGLLATDLFPFLRTLVNPK